MVLVKDNFKRRFSPVRFDYYGHDGHGVRVVRAGADGIEPGDMAFLAEPLPVYGLLNLPDDFLRSLHRLFQDTGKRRFLYCLNRFSGVHGYDTGIGAKGIRGYEIGLGGIL